MTSRITPILAILITIAVTLVYTRPTWTGPISELRDRIDGYDAALVAAERFAQKEAELTRARAAIPPESLSRLEAFLPDGVDNVQLILDLDALAARSGVTLSDFDIKGLDEETGAAAATSQQVVPGSLAGATGFDSSSPIDSVELTMSATGSYTSFRRFLTGIEQSLRPMDIVSISIDQSDTGVYTYDMTVRIYWLR
jgi:hypothetical protein